MGKLFCRANGLSLLAAVLGVIQIPTLPIIQEAMAALFGESLPVALVSKNVLIQWVGVSQTILIPISGMCALMAGGINAQAKIQD